MIRFLEGLGASVGIVLERKRVEEALEEAKDELERRVEERTAALNEVNEKLVSEISERKRTDGALQTSEERYRTLVENLGVGISLIDSDHNIILSNTVLGKWFPRPASEFSGKKCFHEFENREAVCKHCPEY